MQKLVALCKKRGFVFQNSEIYGGIKGIYDFGPLGVRLKNNLKKEWLYTMLQEHENIFAIDGAIINHPRVWEASGHIQNFTDPLVDCLDCKRRFRADHLLENALITYEIPEINEVMLKNNIHCPICQGKLTPLRNFNLLVEVSMGVIEGEKKTTYLKGEACQTIYLNYQNVLHSMHSKIPFGIIQIGKAFRNEITPGHFLFRLREFEQWDLQWFTHKSEMEMWFKFWKDTRFMWYKNLLQDKESIRLREHAPDELAHYAKAAFDIEYLTPFGWKEWEGIHWREDWDLSRHSEFSGKNLTYFDEERNEHYIPWIVETSGGIDRTFLFILLDAYTEETINNKSRVVLKLKPSLAPYQLAIMPLIANNEFIIDKAEEIYQLLRKKFVVIYDQKSSIGKRYRKQDEIGTPFSLTVDHTTIIDETVTIRYRDSMEQIRMPIQKVSNFLEEMIF